MRSGVWCSGEIIKWLIVERLISANGGVWCAGREKSYFASWFSSTEVEVEMVGRKWRQLQKMRGGRHLHAFFFFFSFFFFRVLFCFVCFRSLLEISQTENGIVLTEEIKESKLLVSPLVILLTVLCVRLCCSVTACVLSLSLTLSVCLAFSACLCLYNCVAVCVCVCLCVRVCGCLWFIHVQRLPCSVSVYARLECLHQCSHTVLCLTLAFVCFSLESLSGRIAIIGHYVYVASKRRQ